MSTHHAIPDPERGHSRLLAWPSTRLGWWSVTFSAVFVLCLLVNGLVLMRLPGGQALWQRTLLAAFGIGMLVCGLAAGVLGLTALLGRHERSWLVWLPIIVGAFVVFLLVGEFLFPH
jgi:hypothetical protein